MQEVAGEEYLRDLWQHLASREKVLAGFSYSFSTHNVNFINSKLSDVSKGAQQSGRLGHLSKKKPLTHTELLDLQFFLEQLGHAKILSPYDTMDSTTVMDLAIFKNLIRLDIIKCNPSTFQHFACLSSHLTHLSIDRSIASMSELIGAPDINNPSVDNNITWPSLTTLNASSNYLENMDKSFLGLGRLEYLDLSNNLIERVENLHQCYSLVHLNLAHNRIADVHDSAFSLGNLKILNLADNLLTNTKGLEKLLGLERLDISGNNINRVEDLLLIGHLPNLSALEVRRNQLCENSNYKSEVFLMLLRTDVMVDGSLPSSIEKVLIEDKIKDAPDHFSTISKIGTIDVEKPAGSSSKIVDLDPTMTYLYPAVTADDVKVAAKVIHHKPSPVVSSQKGKKHKGAARGPRRVAQISSQDVPDSPDAGVVSSNNSTPNKLDLTDTKDMKQILQWAEEEKWLLNYNALRSMPNESSPSTASTTSNAINIASSHPNDDLDYAESPGDGVVRAGSTPTGILTSRQRRKFEVKRQTVVMPTSFGSVGSSIDDSPLLHQSTSILLEQSSSSLEDNVRTSDGLSSRLDDILLAYNPIEAGSPPRVASNNDSSSSVPPISPGRSASPSPPNTQHLSSEKEARTSITHSDTHNQNNLQQVPSVTTENMSPTPPAQSPPAGEAVLPTHRKSISANPNIDLPIPQHETLQSSTKMLNSNTAVTSQIEPTNTSSFGIAIAAATNPPSTTIIPTSTITANSVPGANEAIEIDDTDVGENWTAVSGALMSETNPVSDRGRKYTFTPTVPQNTNSPNIPSSSSAIPSSNPSSFKFNDPPKTAVAAIETSVISEEFFVSTRNPSAQDVWEDRILIVSTKIFEEWDTGGSVVLRLENRELVDVSEHKDPDTGQHVVELSYGTTKYGSFSPHTVCSYRMESDADCTKLVNMMQGILDSSPKKIKCMSCQSIFTMQRLKECLRCGSSSIMVFESLGALTETPVTSSAATSSTAVRPTSTSIPHIEDNMDATVISTTRKIYTRTMFLQNDAHNTLEEMLAYFPCYLVPFNSTTQKEQRGALVISDSKLLVFGRKRARRGSVLAFGKTGKEGEPQPGDEEYKDEDLLSTYDLSSLRRIVIGPFWQWFRIEMANPSIDPIIVVTRAHSRTFRFLRFFKESFRWLEMSNKNKEFLTHIKDAISTLAYTKANSELSSDASTLQVLLYCLAYQKSKPGGFSLLAAVRSTVSSKDFTLATRAVVLTSNFIYIMEEDYSKWPSLGIPTWVPPKTHHFTITQHFSYKDVVGLVPNVPGEHPNALTIAIEGAVQVTLITQGEAEKQQIISIISQKYEDIFKLALTS